MSIFITVLGLLGLAGGAAHSYVKGVNQQINKINNNPAHAIPNKYSPGYDDFKKEYSEWESRKKIYDSYCEEEKNIWLKKLNEIIKYCGHADIVEEEFAHHVVHLSGIYIGYTNLKNCKTQFTKVKIKIGNDLRDTIPESELWWKRSGGSEDKRLKFRNIKLCSYDGQNIFTTKPENVLIEDKDGNYSKTMGDFEREAVIETQKLRRFYEKLGFEFPKFPEEYNPYDKWVKSANTDYTRFNK